jgi:hypothetical protein
MNYFETLHLDHSLRNTPLGDLAVEYRNRYCKKWQSIKNWKIYKNTYNELSDVWTINCWRIVDI